MDWRSILKFDENLYNHTDESTKEKHQRILDFIKDRPKTKGTGLRIKEFLDSGELDESFSPLDLPRNSITAKTKEYYGQIGDFKDAKVKVDSLVSNFTNMFRLYRDIIQGETEQMQLKDFNLAFNKLVKNFYYSEIPNLDIDMAGFLESNNEHPSVSNMSAYKEVVKNYLDKFYDQTPVLLLELIEMALQYFLPTTYMSRMSSLNIRNYF